ncbi:MAG: hypothetical protein R2747_18205 [Pyrinomonadaceae bacterium]
MSKKIWKAPPDVRQDYDDTCWAAVLEAFCASNPGRPKLKQAEIVEQFDKFSFSATDGTLTRHGLHTMLRDHRFGLKTEEADHEYFSSTPAYLNNKLGAGMVIIGYWEPKISGWHVGLIYGLDDKTVHYLNPDFSSGGLLKSDISYFGTKGKLVIGWRAW